MEQIVVPPYPAHLSQPERQAVLQKLARDITDAAIAKAQDAYPNAKLPAGMAENMLNNAELVILLRWQGERIARLEQQLNQKDAMH